MSHKKREFELRFAIKKDGKVGSAIWYAWKKKDDIYIVQDKIGGYVKTSLHSNRHCRVAITSENYTRITGKSYSGSRPALTSWDRPETKTDDFVMCVSILFVPELLSPNDVVYDKDTITLESPCSGKAISVDMVFTRLPPEAIAPNPSQRVLGQPRRQTARSFKGMSGSGRQHRNRYCTFRLAKFRSAAAGRRARRPTTARSGSAAARCIIAPARLGHPLAAVA